MKGIHGSSGGWQALDGERRVGPYRLVRELGRGCYGVVYEAERDGLGRRFALKVLTGQALRSPEAVARFEREARLASRIDDPGVVSVHDFGREGRFPYYVMDFVAGETLDDRIRRGRLDPIEAARLVAQLARTVAAAHEVNVVHRDLKPANVILDPRSRRPRITDFGLAQETGEGAGGERLTRTGEAVGTPFYMAPEQNRGERDLDGRVDVYALGVILYQCLTQEVPFNGANFIEISKAIRSGPLTLPRQLVPELPAELEGICLRAMERERHERTPDAGSLAAELEGFLRASGASTEGLPGAGLRQRPASLLALTAAAVALLLLGATSVTWVLFRTRRAARELAAAKATEDPKLALEHLHLAAELAVRRAQQAEIEREVERWGRLGELDEKLREAQGEDLNAVLTEAERAGLLAALESKRQLYAQRRLRSALESKQASAALERELADVERLAPDPAALTGLDEARARLNLERVADEFPRRYPLDPGRALEEARRALSALQPHPNLYREPEVEQLLGPVVEAELNRVASRNAPLGELIAVLDRHRAPYVGISRCEAILGVLRAEALRRRGSYRASIEEARRWLRADDAEVAARAHYVLARSRQRAGEAVMQAFSDLAQRYPQTLYGMIASPQQSAQASQALVNLARARERYGDNVDLLLTEAWYHLSSSDLAKGERCLEQARKLAPDHPRLHMVEGFCFASSDYQRAYDAFRRVLELCERPFYQVLSSQALLALRLQRGDEARQLMDRLVDQRPHAESYVVRAVVRYSAGDRPGSEQDLRAALAENREEAYQVARRYKFDGWLAQLEGARSTTSPLPTPQQPPWGSGKLAEARRKARARSASLDQLLALLDQAEAEAGGDRARAEVQLERIDLLHRRGRYRRSTTLANQLAQRSDVYGLKARYVLAFNQLWTMRFKRGLQTLAEIARLDPRGAVGKNAHAAYLSHTGDNVNGEKLAREAIALEPTWVDPYFSLAFCLNDQRKQADALKVIAAVLPYAPDHPRPYMCRAFASGGLGQGEASLAAYEEIFAITGDQPPPRPLQKHASLAFALRQFDKAISSTTKLLQRQPDERNKHVQFLWLRGLSYHALGKLAEAQADWRECQRLDPPSTKVLLSQTPRHDPAAARAAQAALQGQ